ncbi:hypothetical protein RCF27_09125 [Rhodococcus pyridinivorans]|uniref:hypothetical protein n=1 Tax=Rhodococcus pyridinivorans TaxID=103816 RepID=UPI00280AD46C|nr:hypothetical protein [Rhodococcus pyridinivorans]WMM74420.1 hypothetical protein RCF27_09125 [Rhodococcus pyridinivorans]
MRTIAIKRSKVSDISGTELSELEALRVAIRDHVDVDSDKQIDIAPSELEALKTVNNLVGVTVYYPDGKTVELYATQAEINKWIPIENLKAADNLRGRRKNSAPGFD